MRTTSVDIVCRLENIDSPVLHDFTDDVDMRLDAEVALRGVADEHRHRFELWRRGYSIIEIANLRGCSSMAISFSIRKCIVVITNS